MLRGVARARGGEAPGLHHLRPSMLLPPPPPLRLSFRTQGLWPSEDDGADIQSVDVSKTGELVAKGDDFGRVAVGFFPCAQRKPMIEGAGHGSHVSKVRFTCDGAYLITTGAFSRAIIQYRLHPLGVDADGVGVVVTPDRDLPATVAAGGGEDAEEPMARVE